MAGTWILLQRSCAFGFSASLSSRFARIALFLSFALLVFFTADSWAGAGGSVSGTAKNASNAVVPKATVKATNLDTCVQRQVATNDEGYYCFLNLPVGRYNISDRNPWTAISAVPLSVKSSAPIHFAWFSWARNSFSDERDSIRMRTRQNQNRHFAW